MSRRDRDLSATKMRRPSRRSDPISRDSNSNSRTPLKGTKESQENGVNHRESENHNYRSSSNELRSRKRHTHGESDNDRSYPPSKREQENYNQKQAPIRRNRRTEEERDSYRAITYTKDHPNRCTPCRFVWTSGCSRSDLCLYCHHRDHATSNTRRETGRRDAERAFDQGYRSVRGDHWESHSTTSRNRASPVIAGRMSGRGNYWRQSEKSPPIVDPERGRWQSRSRSATPKSENHDLDVSAPVSPKNISTDTIVESDLKHPQCKELKRAEVSGHSSKTASVVPSTHSEVASTSAVSHHEPEREIEAGHSHLTEAPSKATMILPQIKSKEIELKSDASTNLSDAQNEKRDVTSFDSVKDNSSRWHLQDDAIESAASRYHRKPTYTEDSAHSVDCNQSISKHSSKSCSRSRSVSVDQASSSIIKRRSYSNKTSESTERKSSKESSLDRRSQSPDSSSDGGRRAPAQRKRYKASHTSSSSSNSASNSASSRSRSRRRTSRISSTTKRRSRSVSYNRRNDRRRSRSTRRRSISHHDRRSRSPYRSRNRSPARYTERLRERMDNMVRLHRKNQCTPCRFYWTQVGCRNSRRCTWCHDRQHAPRVRVRRRSTSSSREPQRYKSSSRGRVEYPWKSPRRGSHDRRKRRRYSVSSGSRSPSENSSRNSKSSAKDSSSSPRRRNRQSSSRSSSNK